MGRTLLRLVVFLLLAHALYRFVPPYWHYYQFKDAVRETALYSHGRADAEVVDRVMELAGQYSVPLEREQVQVSQQAQHTYIDAAWIENIEFLPTWRYPWQFEVNADVWHVPGASSR